MEKTWRWFGRKDKITLEMLRQIGVEGIVTALHEVPNGEIWTEEAIAAAEMPFCISERETFRVHSAWSGAISSASLLQAEKRESASERQTAKNMK